MLCFVGNTVAADAAANPGGAVNIYGSSSGGASGIIHGGGENFKRKL